MRGVYVVFCYVIPDIAQIVERRWGELKRRGHFSGDASVCPALFENLANLLYIYKFATLSLSKAFFYLSGNGLFFSQHPVLILILFLNDGKGLVDHLFRAHAGAGSLIENFLLCGFEFEDHGRSFATYGNVAIAIFLEKHRQVLIGYAHHQRQFLAFLLSFIEYSLGIDPTGQGFVLPLRDGNPRAGGIPLSRSKISATVVSILSSYLRVSQGS